MQKEEIRHIYSRNLNMVLYVSAYSTRKMRYLANTPEAAQVKCDELIAKGVNAKVVEYNDDRWAIALPDYDISEARMGVPTIKDVCYKKESYGKYQYTLARKGQTSSSWYMYNLSYAEAVKKMVIEAGYDCDIEINTRCKKLTYCIVFKEKPKGLLDVRDVPIVEKKERVNVRKPLIIRRNAAAIIFSASGRYHEAIDMREKLKKDLYKEVFILRDNMDNSEDIERTRKILLDEYLIVDVLTMTQAEQKVIEYNKGKQHEQHQVPV